MRKLYWLIGISIGVAILTGCVRVESTSPTEPSLPTSTSTPTAQTSPSPTAPRPQWTVVPISATHLAPTDAPAAPAASATPDPAWSDQITLAKQDLAQRLSTSSDQIELVDVQPMVWPDGALGCPQPGMEYTQVQQDGLLIRLRAGKMLYNYHSGHSRGPFLCEKPAPGVVPLPPPGGSIDN